VLVAERSVVAYPDLISDVLNLNTYDPAANWTDLGHTSTPFNFSDGFDTTNWVSQQAGIINVQIGNWNRTINVTFMETKNNKVMDVVHEADGRATNSDGDEIAYFWDKPDVTAKGFPLHMEVKRQKMPNIRAALRQAVSDCNDDRVPVAITRADRGEWLLTMRLEDLGKLL